MQDTRAGAMAFRPFGLPEIVSFGERRVRRVLRSSCVDVGHVRTGWGIPRRVTEFWPLFSGLTTLKTCGVNLFTWEIIPTPETLTL